MSKNTFFTGQPIISQVISLISRAKVNQLARQNHSDHYYKKFKTYHHVVSMLYTVMSGCTSIREVVTGMMVCSGKLNHLGIDYTPRRSTLSDANCKRGHQVFEDIYQYLYKRYASRLPDSRPEKWYKRLYIIDSTTISLFQEILKNAGRSPMNGKRKGGVKAHTLIKADEDVPQLVRLTAAAAHDIPFLKYVQLPQGSIVTFDKAYINHRIWKQWTTNKVTFVSRLRSGSVITVLKQREVNSIQKSKGIISDQEVILGGLENDKVVKVRARLITYHDGVKQRDFTFVTNNFRMAPFTIASIYQKRWQIEILFKRIKQNYPLKYFLGDNENAIKVQIWCVLIVDLLMKVIHKQIKRKWAFSNMVSMIRLHLLTYIDLKRFLNDPDAIINDYTNQPVIRPPTLF